MSKPVPRSRLNISYRTKIDGKQAKAKLPMRLLVLGDFTGGASAGAPALLGDRQVHSIMAGMKLDSFMQELRLTVPINIPGLEPTLLAGRLTGTVTGRLVETPRSDAKLGKVKFTGAGVVTGDKSNGLGSFSGEVLISGEAEVDLENGMPAFTDREVELTVAGKVEPPEHLDVKSGAATEAGVTGNVNGRFTVKLLKNALKDDDTTIHLRSAVESDGVKVHLTIPIRSLGDFKPLHLAASVPEIRRLVLLHRLVLEARNYISSFPELREIVKAELAATWDQIRPKERGKPAVAGEATRLGRLQGELRGRYPQLMLDPKATVLAPKPVSTAAATDVAAPAADAAAAASSEAAQANQAEFDTLLGKMAASAGMEPKVSSAALVARSADSTAGLMFKDREGSFPPPDRFANAVAALLANIDLFPVAKAGEDQDILPVDSIRNLMLAVEKLAVDIDRRVQGNLQNVIQSKPLRALEQTWRSLDDLCREVTSDDVIIDFVDADKELLRTDFEDHSSYILNSALFHKVYIDEYDRYGGRPIGAMIGLYEFDSSDEDVDWLQTMSKISAAAHCPFVAAVSPKFFKVDTWEQLERNTDLEELLALPQFGKWDAFRETHGAAYIGLALPRYLLRQPYAQKAGRNQIINFDEKIPDPEDYLWGNAAVLFARNMVRSFQHSGWCQHITGPVGGGLLKGLPVHMKEHHGQAELQPPVEIAIPDYRELQFANAGFIPLIHCKGTADATFFSARSVKKAVEFEADLDTKNADLVCNLSYTLSITRIAHYVKRMVRDYIGSTADAPYIQASLEAWLVDYVTTAVNPDDLTLLYYPFKAMSVTVAPKPGPFGWYNCIVSVLPHVQFQGMDVELRLEAALGGK